jgi:hypothetical protein
MKVVDVESGLDLTNRVQAVEFMADGQHLNTVKLTFFAEVDVETLFPQSAADVDATKRLPSEPV